MILESNYIALAYYDDRIHEIKCHVDYDNDKNPEITFFNAFVSFKNIDDVNINTLPCLENMTSKDFIWSANRRTSGPIRGRYVFTVSKIWLFDISQKDMISDALQIITNALLKFKDNIIITDER